MARRLPAFQLMWMNYPDTTAAGVVQSIGGHVLLNAQEYQRENPGLTYNTCTIRMSRAFNYSGQPIPGPSAAKAYGMHVISGNDHKWYAFRVRELHNYLWAVYGRPDVSIPCRANTQRQLVGRNGIIEFEAHFSDATGHFDLWNGTDCRYEALFNRPEVSRVNLWEF